MEAEASSKPLESGLKRENYFGVSDDFGNGFPLSFIVDNIGEVLDDSIESQFATEVCGSNHLDEPKVKEEVLFVFLLFENVLESGVEEGLYDFFLEIVFFSHCGEVVKLNVKLIF